MRILKNYISEIYFFVAILYYWSLTAAAINWFAIGLLVILSVLIISKNKVLGITLSLLIIFINLYLLLALFSELLEFKIFNAKAANLIVYGLLFIGLNLIFSITLLYKHALTTKQATVSC